MLGGLFSFARKPRGCDRGLPRKLALGRGGQESAPFELLIAVIVMGFVIFVGMRAMSQLNCQKCVGETEAKLEELKTKIEIVVTQKSPQTISFYTSGCFSSEDEMLIIKDETEPQVCAAYCGSAKNICTVLKYVYNGKNCDQISMIKCLNISPETVFATESCSDESCRCKDREESEGLELVGIRDEMPHGHYLLLNKSRVTDTFPTVCAYRYAD
ncbi:MAG: hypothetical protein NTW59_01605 [Candidatus Diapherotrites archaeon]|nr:hypothetical protein [Candidatus Diapherotrites archaeon]